MFFFASMISLVFFSHHLQAMNGLSVCTT